MAAAEAAADNYKNVFLFDKNPFPARKLISRTAEYLFVAEKVSAENFADAFGPKKSFVTPALKSFGWKEISAQLKKMGVKVGPNGGNRLMISPDDISKLSTGFVKVAESAGIIFKKSCRVTDLIISHGSVKEIVVNGISHPVSAVIVACGSYSAPKIGSTRDGYEFARKAGHEIIPLKAAMVGLETVEKYGKLLDGVTVRDCRIDVYLEDELRITDRGSLIFTKYGLNGQLIQNHSAQIIELIKKGNVEIHIDQVPDMTKMEISKHLDHEFPHADRTTLFEHLNPHLPDGLLDVMDKIIRVHSGRPVSHLTTLEKKHMVLWLKDFAFTIKKPRPFNETMGVLGGVSLNDIDPGTMASKKIKNLYFAGEVLDLLGPWGGYNIEMAFSTGHLAGISASSALNGGKINRTA